MVKLIPTKEEWYKALVERHGEDIQKKFASATVAICGLGGLGSNIAVALARAGIGKLILIDFDKVDSLSIECRQKLKKYSPRTIAQASRISGVSPADISVLLVYFGR